MAGACAAAQFMRLLGMPLLVGLPFAFCGVMGFLIDVLVLRPLRKRNTPHVIPMIATIGVAIILNNGIQGLFGAENLRFPAGTIPDAAPVFAGIYVTVLELGIVLASFVLMGVLMLSLQRTQVGRALRAIAESPKAAYLVGVNVEGLFYLTSVVAAGPADLHQDFGAVGVAGGLQSPQTNWLAPSMRSGQSFLPRF